MMTSLMTAKSHALLAESVDFDFFLLVHTTSKGCFDQGTVIHDRIIEPETTGKVVGFEAIPFKNPGSNVAAQTALADHIDSLSGFDLVDPFPQFIHGDVSEAVDMSPAVLAHGSGIQ